MRLVDRFMSFVKTSEEGCWEWIGTTAGRYGQFSVFKKRVPAHVVSFELFVGRVQGYLICHHCDNPTCVRPSHLFRATASGNMQDMIAKGRHPKQVARYRCKLTAANVLEIRGSTKTVTDLAASYHVSHSLITKIRQHKLWRHIP